MKQLTRSFQLILLTILSFSSYGGGIDFHHDLNFQEALDLARKEGKLVFMDCYTSWCGPCRRLASTVFTDSVVGSYFNNNYVNVKFDMEKEEGPTIANRYQVTAYPTLFWLDPNGSIKNKVVGGLDALALIEAGKKAADPIPDIMAGMDKKYADGLRDEPFLEAYLKLYNSIGRDKEAILAEYIRLAQSQHWPRDKYAPFVYDITTALPSAGTEVLLKEKNSLVAKYGIKAYDEKIASIAEKALSLAKKKNDTKLLNDAITFVKAGSSHGKQEVARMQMDYYLHTANVDVYDKYVSSYLKKYGSEDAKLLNDIAWEYYINLSDDTYLKKAMLWAYKAVNLKNTYTNNTTYAYLQYKLHNYSEATKACDYAILKATDENVQPKSAQALKAAIIKELSSGTK